MEIKDLRIGNYICTSYMRNNVFKVTAIYSDRVDFESLSGDFKSDIIPIYVEPISITRDWLLKFGFRYNTPFYNDASDIYFYENNGKLFCEIPDDTTLLHIQYVHQLQNLYYFFTNSELVIQ